MKQFFLYKAWMKFIMALIGDVFEASAAQMRENELKMRCLNVSKKTMGLEVIIACNDKSSNGSHYTDCWSKDLRLGTATTVWNVAVQTDFYYGG